MLWRDWRAGELRLLAIGLVLAVGALSSVGFLADRLQRGLERDARQMLGADLVVRADAPLPPSYANEAASLGLRTARTAIFPTMVTTTVPASAEGTGGSRLTSLKAVSPGYPLRGAVRIARRPGASDQPATGIPAPGTVWVDAALLDALHLRVGDTVRVGRRTLSVAAVITREMDRGFGFASLSPRLMMREEDLPSTGLIQFGSRVTYRLQVAGPEDALARFAAWARPQVARQRGVALETLKDGQPQVRRTLDRAARFLSLVALLAAVLAAVAIGVAAHRYSARHLDGYAVMRCFGAARGTLRGMLAIEFLLLGGAASLLGIALGYVAHVLLLQPLSSVIHATLPPPSWRPAALGFACGLVLLLGFALPPLLPLVRVPPLHAFRREWGNAIRQGWLGYGMGALAFAALLLVAARDVQLGALVAGGFAVAALLFGTVAWLVLALLAAGAKRRSGKGAARIGWRYAAAGLRRRGLLSAAQVTALALGLMALLLLSITRNDLLAGWRQATPPDAPNRFVIDIQPGQQQPVRDALQRDGLADVALSPMVRARLTAIDGRPITGENYTDPQARRLAEREFNLSYADRLPDGNRIAAGRWYGADAQTPQISMEAGIAKTLGIKLGDTVRFEVAGQAVQGPVTSLRKLEWGSMRVNFFVLMPPSALRDFPATWITAFHLDAAHRQVTDDLVRQFPNLTVIDTGAILAELQQILSQVIDAVQGLFVFTLAAGILVLYAALAGTRDERMREAGLLRALGASARQIRRVHQAELVMVGALAGLLAAAGAALLGWLLAREVFGFALSLDPWLPMVGAGAGILCALAGGWPGLRAILRQPPLRTLRDA